MALRLELADYLQSAGANVSFYRKTLCEVEETIFSESMDERVANMASLVVRYSKNGEKESAYRIVLSLIRMAFGVGYHKDYQCGTWVSWLAKALAQPEGEGCVEDAAWLARVLVATNPTTEGAPGSAAVHLPSAVVPADPVAAVRIFEFLVRHHTVDHLECLAALIDGLLTHSGAEEIATVELAADITAELLAPAANRAHPKLAESLIVAAKSGGKKGTHTILAKSVTTRTDKYALSTTRNEWRQGLGLGTEDGKYKHKNLKKSNNHHYDALVLSDGQRIARDDVASHIRNADDIISFRHRETDDSLFHWAPIIDQLTFTQEDLQKLTELFDDGSRENMRVFLSLGKAAERNGYPKTALSFANRILQEAESMSWSRLYDGGTRQHAAAVAIRLGDADARANVCKYLVHDLNESRWLAPMLLNELDNLVAILDPDLDAPTIWREVRSYIEGIAESLILPGPDVLQDHGCYWWMPTPNGDRRVAAAESNPQTALAELAVGHLSHPAFLVRDAATAIVIRALGNKFRFVAEALARFAQPNSSDEILERTGRCLAGAKSQDGYVIPASLQSLVCILSNHPSQIIRDLVDPSSSSVHRPLSPLYQLNLPQPADTPIGSIPVLLIPHLEQYAILADDLGLNFHTLLAIAAHYASTALATLPDPEVVRSTLNSSSQIQFRYSTMRIAASRAAFGRVLADIRDAGLLEDASPEMCRRLRTLDIDALSRTAESRPEVLPPAPPAGHDQTIARWREEIKDRLEQYLTMSIYKDRVLIGARSRLRVLNWGYLEETFQCGTTIGTKLSLEDRILASCHSMTLKDLATAPVGRLPKNGDPLIIENSGDRFHQVRADWLSFNPEFAAKLAWIADPTRPGCWRTVAGELAVETIWWVDGWYGRAGPVFDNTEAEGHAVVATSRAIADIANTFGATTRHFKLTRCGRNNGSEVEPVSTNCSLPLVIPDV